MPIITTTEACRYKFTDSELVNIAKDQARLHGDQRTAEEEFDSVKAAQKERLTRIETEISSCTRRVTAGYEMRQIKCLVLKFRPDAEHALLVRTDNGRVLRKRKLDDSEKQLTLTTDTPPNWAFTTDLYADSDSDIAEMVAEGVPLTDLEAAEIREHVKLMPTRRMIDGGGKPSKK